MLPVDTDSFMAELKTAVSQFNLNVGEVEALPSGTKPTVAVRKPAVAGGEVYIDIGIPRGAPGAPGEDGDRAPTVYVEPEGEGPRRSLGAVWLVEDRGRDPHEITAIRVFETGGLYPGTTCSLVRRPGREVPASGATTCSRPRSSRGAVRVTGMGTL